MRLVDDSTNSATPSQNDTPPANLVSVEVRVPGLVRDCTDGLGRFTVQAATLNHAMERIFETFPRLRVHLYDEQGNLRRHILLFYNQTNFSALDDPDRPLQPGDRINIVQAVSGGQ